MRLRGATAIVTGGGSGIGRAISLRFAGEGAAVTVVDVTGDRAEATARDIRDAGGAAWAAEADVSRAADVEAMAAGALARHGAVRILVNNAGASTGDDILAMDEADWDRDLAVVLKSVFLCSRAVLPAMLDAGGGSIVNISSVNGLGAYGEEAYSAAKAGIVNLTRNLAVKYGGRGVRVNCICPGTIRTPIFARELARDPRLFERLAAWYPLGRVGEPEDVAGAALFLASGDASWMTGATLVLDGGLTAGSHRMTRELLGLAGEPG